MSHKIINTGRVLYVAVGGNNLSARVGDVSKPWKTPQDARDASQEGDLIYVFPGVYTYGNEGSGADYEGVADVSNDLANMQVALNYGKTDINYYFEYGSIMQGLSTGAGSAALFYEPSRRNPETPSTMKVNGHLTVDTVGAFLKIVYEESDWDIEFHKVVNCSRGIASDANYITGGGLDDVIHFKKLKIKGDYLNVTGEAISVGFTGGSQAGIGREGLSRGYLNIDIDRVIGTGLDRYAFLYNYDVSVRIRHYTISWGFIQGMKNTIIHYDVETLETLNDSQGAIEYFSAMPDAEIYYNIRYFKRHPDATNHFAGIQLTNAHGTGGKVFINIGNMESDDCIKIQQQATLNATSATLGAVFGGPTKVIISGNFIELNSNTGVIAVTGSAITTDGVNDIRIKLKDASLITEHTNSITSAVAKSIIMQNVVSNKISDGNITEEGQAMVVNTDYIF